MFTFRETDGLPGMTWCLRFGVEHFPEWKDQFTIHLWEGKNKISYAKTKVDEQRYIQDAYGDIEMGNQEEDNEAQAEEEDAEDGNESSDSAASDHEEEDESDSEAFAKGSKNEQLAVGYKNDLSFVTRGNMIGVFGHQGDKFKFRTAIDRVKDLEGNSFAPQKVRKSRNRSGSTV
jgi:hypothetical protein